MKTKTKRNQSNLNNYNFLFAGFTKFILNKILHCMIYKFS